MFDYKHNYDIQHDILYIDANFIEKNGLENTVELIKSFKADLIIERERNDGKALYQEAYAKLPKIPKAWWCVDMHCNLIEHLVYAKQFDFIFCAQSWFMPIVEREVKAKVYYLPLCHTQTLTEYEEMLKEPIEKDIEFSFIGNIRSIHVDRERHVQNLLKQYPDFFARQSNYEDTLKYLRQSRFTFNCSLNNDLNFRVWEAVACDTHVLTDEVADLDSLYYLKHFVTQYKKLGDTSKMPETILNAGSQTQFIKEGHTLTHRMNQMIEMVDTGGQYEYN